MIFYTLRRRISGLFSDRIRSSLSTCLTNTSLASNLKQGYQTYYCYVLTLNRFIFNIFRHEHVKDICGFVQHEWKYFESHSQITACNPNPNNSLYERRINQ